MKKYPIKSDEKFKFTCKEDCTDCCKGPGVQLFPFDIYRLTRGLDINTKDLFEKNAEIVIKKGSKFPLAKLKSDEKTKECTFLKDGKCSVYEHRPMLCRSYPVGRGLRGGKWEYYLDKDKCPGIGEGEEFTPETWFKDESDKRMWLAFLSFLKAVDNKKILEVKAKNKQLSPYYAVFSQIMYNFDVDAINEFKKKYKLRDAKNKEEQMKFSLTMAKEFLLK